MIKLAVGLLIFIGGSSAYDIGCLYPPDMPNDPFTARGAFNGGNLDADIETPYIVHSDTWLHICEMNCIAFHDAKSLDMLTLQRPIIDIPTEYHNTWARNMCIFQCYGMIVDSEKVSDLFEDWNFPLLSDNADVFDCRNTACLGEVIEQYDHDPRIIGQVVYRQWLNFIKNDGWNYFGEYKYDHTTDGEVECVADCQRYADTIGYFPVNNPRRVKPNQKYTVEGRDKRWQPIQETDGYGNFKRQEHVAAHIGYTVNPFLFSEFKEADDPMYDYQYEAALVVNRTRDLASDAEKQSKVKFYDNKLLVRSFLQRNMEKYRPEGLQFEDYLLYITALGAVEHDAIVQCWREKVRFDLVRPTTVIQRWGSDLIETGVDSEPIEAHDFQAFVRVMPHAEYPSGSASLCTSYADYTQAYTLHHFGEEFGESIDLNDISLPGLNFDIDNLEQLATDCGESRLWGGMHFTASVQAGKDIVEGNGALALEWALLIKNGSDWGNHYESGSSRPTCDE